MTMMKRKWVAKILHELIYTCNLIDCEDCPFHYVDTCRLDTPQNWVYDGILCDTDLLQAEGENKNANTNH